MSKSKKAKHRGLYQYPMLQYTLTSIICNSIKGLNENKPVLLEIDSSFIYESNRYKETSLDWWGKYLSSYFLTAVSLAQTSIWIKLNRSSGGDIFGEGTYLYNCELGSFEVEVNSNGVLADIFGEFDGKTPSFIFDLLKDYPNQKFKINDKISEKDTISDEELTRKLRPVPYKIIELD